MLASKYKLLKYKLQYKVKISFAPNWQIKHSHDVSLNTIRNFIQVNNTFYMYFLNLRVYYAEDLSLSLSLIFLEKLDPKSILICTIEIGKENYIFMILFFYFGLHEVKIQIFLFCQHNCKSFKQNQIFLVSFNF